ncbi:MAG: glycoside hydrolase family 38 C-terminal domain-containing protein, partial [Eubacteriales bacterium]
KFGKCDGRLEIGIRLIWDEKSKMVKLRVPTVFGEMKAKGEVSYGEQELRMDGRENVTQRYIILSDGGDALSVINSGTYGSSIDGNALRVSLLRSPGYTAHPIGDRKVMPQDRHSAYVEQGERLYSFTLLFGGADEIAERTPRAADAVNEAPMTLSFFPSGAGELPSGCAKLEGSEKIRLSALKKAEDGRGYIARLFNPSCGEEKVTFVFGSTAAALTLGKYEILSLRIYNGSVVKCDLCENDLK